MFQEWGVEAKHPLQSENQALTYSRILSRGDWRNLAPELVSVVVQHQCLNCKCCLGEMRAIWRDVKASICLLRSLLWDSRTSDQITLMFSMSGIILKIVRKLIRKFTVNGSEKFGCMFWQMKHVLLLGYWKVSVMRPTHSIVSNGLWIKVFRHDYS